MLPVRHSGFNDAASVAGVAGSSISRDEGVPPRPIAPGIAGSGAVGTCKAPINFEDGMGGVSGVPLLRDVRC